MIVVPHAHHVVLTYEATSIDWLGIGASGFGLVGAIALVRSGKTPSPEPEPTPDPVTEELLVFIVDRTRGEEEARDGSDDPPPSESFESSDVPDSRRLDPDEPWQRWFGNRDDR